MRRSIERHLLHEYGGEKVTLTRIEHRPPMPDEFDSLGRKLTAEDSYVKLPETARGASR